MHDHFHTTDGLTRSRAGKRARPAHPDDVLTAAYLTVSEKRALLASWSSDARAVTGAPALRRLDDGQLVEIDDILDALKRLDEIEDDEDGSVATLVPTRLRAAINRQRDKASRNWRNLRHRRDDDDDDPPPCPVAVWPRPFPPLDAEALVQAA